MTSNFVSNTYSGSSKHFITQVLLPLPLELREKKILKTQARKLIRSLAPHTHSLAPHCSLRSRAPLHSFVRSLAHSFAPPLVCHRDSPNKHNGRRMLNPNVTACNGIAHREYFLISFAYHLYTIPHHDSYPQIPNLFMNSYS